MVFCSVEQSEGVGRHPDFAKEFQLKKECEVDTQREGTQGQRANIDFQIADISDNMLSLGKLLRNGFVFNLRGETDSIMYHQRDPTTTVQLFLHKNSLRIRANRRLDELALPKHGTKLDKWPRLEKRENELMRERKTQAAIEAERESGPEGRRREAAIPISDPGEPTNTEKVHELTHLPLQPWCEQCVRGRGTESSQAGDVRARGIQTSCHCV